MADKKMPQLLAPTNISTKADKASVVITWEDPNGTTAPMTAGSYTYSFIQKPTEGSDLPEFDPQKPPVPTKVTPKGRKTATYSVTITPGAKDPKPDDLVKHYLARVVAVGDGKTHSSSPAGIEAYWHTTFGVTISIGDKEFTLTQDSLKGNDGIYRLPISKDDPFRVSYANLHEFAKSVSLDLPDHWPGGKPIDTKGHLEIDKLAVNLPLRLFEIDIAVDMPDLSPIPGVKIKHLEMAVERTDGVHGL